MKAFVGCLCTLVAWLLSGCSTVAAGPEPRQSFPKGDSHALLFDEVHDNLRVTEAIEEQALRKRPLSELVSVQVEAMLAFAREHGRGDVPAKLEPGIQPPSPSRDQRLQFELSKIAGAALQLIPYLELDPAPSQLSRAAFVALSAKLAGDAVYDERPSKQTTASNFTLALRDGVGLLAFRELDDRVADRALGVLAQWSANEHPPRAILLDFSRCEDASPPALAALFHQFAPGRLAFELSYRERGTSELRRASFGSEQDWSVSQYARVPVLVLVSGRTGSLAEAVAHALRYHRDAQVLGLRTEGEGRLMSFYELSGGSRFGFAVAEVFGSDGKSLRGVPLLPDACRTESGAVVQLVPRTDEVFAERCTGGELSAEAALDYARDPLGMDTVTRPTLRPR